MEQRGANGALRIIVHGAAGRMGGVLIQMARACGIETVGVDICAAGGELLPSLTGYTGAADAVVDFSHHSAIGALLDWACARGLPAVICTTGHSEAECARIAEAARTIPVFQSANMSLGIAALMRAVTELLRLFPQAEVEIVESHHDAKLDAPSGTALLLAEAVRRVRLESRICCGRSGHALRQPGEIGVHSLRMGRVIGDHEVLIATPTQTFTLRHSAGDRALFAEGALAAVRFLIGCPAGFYTMEDLLTVQKGRTV